MKSWILMAIMATVFSVIGIVLVLVAFLTSTWPLLSGLIFLLLGVVAATFVPAARREQGAAGVEAPAAVAGVVPFERVADLIRERLSGTPYVVTLEGALIRVHADLADAEFLGLASAHKVKVVRGLEVVAKAPGVAVTRDFEQDLEVSLGIGRLSGEARLVSGRTWTYQRRIEYGVGKDGSLGRQVDVRFSSKELQDPVNDVLKDTGWHTGFWGTLPADGKMGLVFAAVAGGGAVVAGIVLGIAALLGRFS